MEPMILKWQNEKFGLPFQQLCGFNNINWTKTLLSTPHILMMCSSISLCVHLYAHWWRMPSLRIEFAQANLFQLSARRQITGHRHTKPVPSKCIESQQTEIYWSMDCCLVAGAFPVRIEMGETMRCITSTSILCEWETTRSASQIKRVQLDRDRWQRRAAYLHIGCGGNQQIYGLFTIVGRKIAQIPHGQRLPA